MTPQILPCYPTSAHDAAHSPSLHFFLISSFCSSLCPYFSCPSYFSLSSLPPSSNQLCINTAIVYMHRFYTVHSFRSFNRAVSWCTHKRMSLSLIPTLPSFYTHTTLTLHSPSHTPLTWTHTHHPHTTLTCTHTHHSPAHTYTHTHKCTCTHSK